MSKKFKSPLCEGCPKRDKRLYGEGLKSVVESSNSLARDAGELAVRVLGEEACEGPRLVRGEWDSDPQSPSRHPDRIICRNQSLVDAAGLIIEAGIDISSES